MHIYIDLPPQRYLPRRACKDSESGQKHHMASEHISSHLDLACMTSRYTRTTLMTWWHTRILHDTLRYTGATLPHWCITWLVCSSCYIALRVHIHCLTPANSCNVSVNPGPTSYKIFFYFMQSQVPRIWHWLSIDTFLCNGYCTSLCMQRPHPVPRSVADAIEHDAAWGEVGFVWATVGVSTPWSPARCGLALRSRSFEPFWFSWSRLGTCCICWWVKLQDCPLSTFSCDTYKNHLLVASDLITLIINAAI